MTPEEWARQIAEAVIIEVLTRRPACDTEDDHAAITAMIAGTISAAVLAEREACAKLMERFGEEHCDEILPGICKSLGCDSYVLHCDQARATAIRARA